MVNVCVLPAAQPSGAEAVTFAVSWVACPPLVGWTMDKMLSVPPPHLVMVELAVRAGGGTKGMVAGVAALTDGGVEAKEVAGGFVLGEGAGWVHGAGAPVGVARAPVDGQ